MTRFAGLVAAGQPVLDLACGNGRHGRHFLQKGHPVLFLDRDTGAVQDLTEGGAATVLTADLEDGSPWPLAGQYFAGIVVTNYLFRPVFPKLLDALAPGGVLIYETFARGNEIFGRPRNPDHLLAENELLDLTNDQLHIVAFEQGMTDKTPIPGVIQRLCGVKKTETSLQSGAGTRHPLSPA
ncbi:MAG: class I SAM-dependent methyltransferase [Magnetospiraceae bacterium]